MAWYHKLQFWRGITVREFLVLVEGEWNASDSSLGFRRKFDPDEAAANLYNTIEIPTWLHWVATHALPIHDAHEVHCAARQEAARWGRTQYARVYCAQFRYLLPWSEVEKALKQKASRAEG